MKASHFLIYPQSFEGAAWPAAREGWVNFPRRTMPLHRFGLPSPISCQELPFHVRFEWRGIILYYRKVKCHSLQSSGIGFFSPRASSNVDRKRRASGENDERQRDSASPEVTAPVLRRTSTAGCIGKYPLLYAPRLHNNYIQGPSSRTYCRRSRRTRLSVRSDRGGDTRRFIANGYVQ